MKPDGRAQTRRACSALPPTPPSPPPYRSFPGARTALRASIRPATRAAVHAGTTDRRCRCAGTRRGVRQGLGREQRSCRPRRREDSPPAATHTQPSPMDSPRSGDPPQAGRARSRGEAARASEATRAPVGARRRPSQCVEAARPCRRRAGTARCPSRSRGRARGTAPPIREIALRATAARAGRRSAPRPRAFASRRGC